MNTGNTQLLEGVDLRELIRKSGYRFGYVAERVGITPQNLNNKLNSGRFLPHQQKRLADVLAMPVSELFPVAPAEPIHE